MAKLAISITHAKDDADKATVGMVIANAAIASGQETVLFLSTEGVYLAKSGYVADIHEEGFAPLADLLHNYQEAGGTVWVCSPCFKKRGLAQEHLIPGATIVGGAKLVEFLSQGAACITY